MHFELVQRQVKSKILMSYKIKYDAKLRPESCFRLCCRCSNKVNYYADQLHESELEQSEH